MRVLPLCLALLVLASACGGASGGPDAGAAGLDAGHGPGSPCAPLDTGLCYGTSQAVWCEDGKWTLINCRGPKACSASADDAPGCGGSLVCKGGIACDLEHSFPGDPCPTAWEGSAVCWVADAGIRQALQCRLQMMTILYCASDCTEAAGKTFCPTN